ncbi:hypothetical protein PAAG_05992 [Paracoccidioides lutzii Pb01]|uniref:Rhodopsin domain-containing protein n=1 Tax=Paracoccidioides lutzii (strain ATCC MYA-826 / Pb01) TaxID=502779 RepID=C1H5F1_PARBA|nr:hypothetical protein PAAG_05992 [Paracoccidioides lutzii Pb01]EEH34945.1 hypothetical protein PAAG_05992 [Paracoccidioides lutzii Pb01]
MDAADVASKRDRGPEIFAVTLALTIFGAVFVCARLVVRHLSARTLGWDDTFLFLAMLSGLAGQGLTIAGVVYGSGKPFLTLDIADVVQAMKCSTFAILCNGIAMALLKVGLGTSLLRLDLSKFFNIVIAACIVLSLLVNLTVLPTTFGGCRPMKKIWNKDPKIPGTCWPAKVNLVMSYIQTVGNIVTDLAFSIGPLVYLSKVKVSLYNRWALRGVFLVGLIATACAIAKATELPNLVNVTDPTYTAVNLTLWVKAEFNAGLFAASLPALKSVFEKVMRKFGVVSGSSTPGNTYGYGNGDSSARKRYRDRSSRSRSHASMGGFDFAEIDSQNHTAYVMKDMSQSSQIDTRSMEDDQQQILETDSSGQYITKTTEYSVSRATLDSEHRAV